MQVPSVRRRLSSVAFALALAVLAVGVSPHRVAVAVAQEAAGPTTSFEAWFEVEQPPTVPFEAVQLIVDFPVGSRVARHVHGGPGYITMLESEMTMWIGAEPGRPYLAGESFVEPYRLVAEGANLSPAPSSLLVTYLIPVGSAVTTLEGASAPSGQLPPGAVPRFESRMRFEAAPGRYKLGHMLKTFEPGVWSVSGEPAASRLMTVVAGEVTVLTGATQQTYTAGQMWIETPGQAWLSGNLGSVPAVVALSTTMPQD
jgi:quercetin dioxygenase-like cupin family protein